MSNDNFWKKLIANGVPVNDDADLDFAGTFLHMASDDRTRIDSAIERRLMGLSVTDGSFDTVRQLTDSYTAGLNLAPGTRVAFRADAASMLAYPNPPAAGEIGSVVELKTASGPATSFAGKVFVRFADGRLDSIFARHLVEVQGTVRQAAAPPTRRKVASLGDLTEFLKLADDTLVHKATRDLWKLSRDTEGYVIERLFDDNGSPQKV